MERKIVFTPTDVESVALECTTCGSEVVLPGWSESPTSFHSECPVCYGSWNGDQGFTIAKQLLRVLRSLATTEGSRLVNVKITLDDERA